MRSQHLARLRDHGRGTHMPKATQLAKGRAEASPWQCWQMELSLILLTSRESRKTTAAISFGAHVLNFEGELTRMTVHFSSGWCEDERALLKAT